MNSSTSPSPSWVLPVALGVASVGATYIYAKSKGSKKSKSTFYSAQQVGQVQLDGGKSTSDISPPTYDFIIVGGGTAALVLANRLTEDPNITVLVLEAGGSSLSVKASVIPVMFKYLQRNKYDWNYKTVPQAGLNGRECHWTRAKLLGGCSASNAMMFNFGAPEDYDEWDQIAKRINPIDPAEGWGYGEMKKYFMKMERFVPHPDVPLDTTERGKDGPVQAGYFGYFSKFGAAFLKSCEAVGIPIVDDVNTSKGPLGVTRTPTYIDSRGRRVSAESSYLTPEVIARKNLKVATGVHVTKVRVEINSTTGVKTATGVEFVSRQSERTAAGEITYFASAKYEVVLSAGSLNTPQILLLSGIGPVDELKRHSIPVIQDLPGVGRHLQDHVVINLRYQSRPGISNRRTLEPSSWSDYLMHWKAIAQYLRSRTGVLTSNTQCCMGFVRLDDSRVFNGSEKMADIDVDSTSLGKGPDLELMGAALSWKDHGHSKFLGDPDSASISVVLLRPMSEGTVTLRSSNPFDAPVIDPRYLSTEHDVEVLRRGMKLASRISRAEPTSSLLDHENGELHAHFDHNLDQLSKEELTGILKDRIETLYHPTSTARMAPLSEGGVVNDNLKVYGVEGLRVVDASIMPEIVSGHTAGPTFGIAEKAADMIRASLTRS